jgi:peptidoglycan/LPS O-acetylase OafA/YrhL
MDRRRTSLVLLVLFVACTAIAIVVSGSRPGLQQGVAPTVIQFVGYFFALAAGLLLLRPEAGSGRDDRATAALVLGGLALLVATEVISQGGTDIGAGLLRLFGLIALGIGAVRLAQGVAVARRAR